MIKSRSATSSILNFTYEDNIIKDAIGSIAKAEHNLNNYNRKVYIA